MAKKCFMLIHVQRLIMRTILSYRLCLVSQGETLSYAELDQRVNQLAHHLINMGVGPEVPVGVLMDRSLELVVAMLGILKGGGAYVPLDPSYPPDRLALMMEDSEVSLTANSRRHP